MGTYIDGYLDGMRRALEVAEATPFRMKDDLGGMSVVDFTKSQILKAISKEIMEKENG